MHSRILVVEDSATQAMALCMTLEERDFVVTRAASGEEALTHLARSEFDLVLTDIVMPGMSGYDLCQRIKDDAGRSHLPVVLLTSLGDPLDIVRGLECGADNYVTKPYDPDYLCARVRHVLDRQRLRRNPKASLGVNVSFMGTSFSISSDKEQILDLFISSVEDVVRTNRALQESQRELATAQAQLEEYARGMRRQAELSSDKYAALMQNASDAITVLDCDGRIVEANARAAELLGVPQHELDGRLLCEFAVGQCASRLGAELGRLRDKTQVTAELEFTHASGRVATCDFSASRAHGEGWDLALVILHDVTELRAATNQARRSQAKLTQAQHLASIGSFDRDLSTGRSEWSAETWRIFGLPADSVGVSSERFLSMVDPRDCDNVMNGIAMTARGGPPFALEYRIIRPDGAERVVQTRGEAVLDARGVPVGLLGTIQDVTEQKQLEARLRQAQKMEAVGQLAGGVAHDFNNLLTVITSYSVMLLDELSPTSPIRADVEQIAAAAQRAEVLTQQLLAFSRQQVLQPQLVDVSGVARELQTLLRRLVREDVEIVMQLDPATSLAWTDPGQLEQVLVNLVVNARDAMPDGGTVTIRTATCERPASVAVDATVEGQCVLVEVSDTGTGMDAATQARIFEPFFTTKEVGKGTGLGLSTVYGIVQQSGGDIVVESTPGSGTTFTVYLPLGQGCEAPRPRLEEPVTPPTTGGESVLVVEDDDGLRGVACRVLRQQGYSVLEARQGREALQVCAQQDTPIDLILSDIMMPEMGGYELGAQIAELRPDISVLFMSGYSHESVKREGGAPAGIGFLQKPFTPATLAAKVRETLDRPARLRAS